MPGIGETLREARMRQRLDINDAESATKIRAKYLRALENEEFDLLHGPTFVRSFLRTYAEWLGLDARRLIDEYRAQFEPRSEADLHPIVARPQQQRKRGTGPPGRGTVVIVLVVALLGFLAVLGLTGDEDEDGGRPAAATDTTAERERPARRERRRRSRPPRATPRRVTLRIAPDGATYVCVDRGAGTDVVFEGTLESPRTFRGRRLRLNLGKPSARLRVNGRAVDLEDGPDPVGFEFTPRSRKPLPEEQRPCV